MEQNLPPKENQKIARQAFRTFALLALIVYVLILGFCYTSGHFFEMGFIGAVTLAAGTLVYVGYRSL